MKEYIFHYTSKIGDLTIASDGKNITGLWFDGQKYDRATLTEAGEETGLDTAVPVLSLAKRWLDIYFSGREPGFDVPLAPRGTAFQREVWALLTKIPRGQTVTYKMLAETIARAHRRASMSAQAVGGAVGRNPISILIPCHRVLGAGGQLTGYAAGIEKKEYLLRLEGAL